MRTLYEAWRDWSAGVPVRFEMFGLSLLWWGRIGKLLEFFAALTIIADIIGPVKLRAFGDALHHVFTTEAARTRVGDVVKWIRALVGVVVATVRLRQDEAKAWLEKLDTFQAARTNRILAATLAIALAVLLIVRTGDLLSALFCGVLVYAYGGGSVMPLVTVMMTLIAVAVGLVIDLLVIEPVAWFIEHERVENRIKAFSILLLVVGFHFDLLAS